MVAAGEPTTTISIILAFTKPLTLQALAAMH